MSARVITVGLDSFGAGRLIAVRLNDPKKVASDNSALASILSVALPDTVETKTYEAAAQQIGDGIKAKGIDATVRVIDAASVAGAAPSSSALEVKTLLLGAGLGAAATGLVALIVKRR